jgi:hypothetical protein
MQLWYLKEMLPIQLVWMHEVLQRQKDSCIFLNVEFGLSIVIIITIMANGINLLRI